TVGAVDMVFATVGMLALKLAPDAFEFRVHHTGGNVEIMFVIEDIQQSTLYVHARKLIVLALHLLPDGFTDLGNIVKAKLLSKFIVQRRRDRLADFLDVNLED